MPAKTHDWKWHALFVALPLICLLSPALVRDESFVYRDAAHFYYPLFEWTAREWTAGRVPIWNPQDNCGVPVVGDATSSVFYPGKLVFALPWLSFAARYKLYIVGHVALAAAAASIAVRRWGASAPASAICAISYAYGGNVLFQLYNVVFLVGAAWLPLAFLAAERMLAERSWKHALWLGVVLALMTLGGDPQTGYHVGLLAALYALFVGRAANAASEISLLRKVATSRFALLSLAATTGTMLAAIQILPALQWSAASDRAEYDRPRNIYESAAYLRGLASGERQLPADETSAAAAVVGGLAGVPAPDSHHETSYEFSVGPWRFAELLWPNFSGRPFPDNRRWINALPAEGRPWVPSLYAGLLPLFVGLGSIRLWSAAPRIKWLSWIALLAAIASLGGYGLGWLAQEAYRAAAGGDANGLPVGGQTGGLYWLLVVVLPGYVQFRYPAKWLVPAALALSLLAAHGWDRIFAQRPARLRWALAAGAWVSAGGAFLVAQLFPVWKHLTSGAPVDHYFGSLDVNGSAYDLLGGLIQTMILCGLFWWLLGKSGGKHSGHWSWAAVAITAVELAWAQYGLIATAPTNVWTDRSPFSAAIEACDARHLTGPYRVFRVFADDWLPPNRMIGEHRQTANARWERATFFPRYHLLETSPRISLVESSTTLTAQSYSSFLEAARGEGVDRPDGVLEPSRKALNALSAKYLILPEGFSYPGCERIAEHEGAALWHNPAALPRARIERGDEPADPQESCKVLVDAPQRIGIEAVLTRPGRLVLGDLDAPGWQVEVTSEAFGENTLLPIVRTDGFKRGVLLPEGKHRVSFFYRPAWFYGGASISAIAWSAMVIFCAGLYVIAMRRQYALPSKLGR